MLPALGWVPARHNGPHVLAHLSDVLQHGHPRQLLLDNPKIVDFIPELGAIGCMLHLPGEGESPSCLRVACGPHPTMPSYPGL